MAEKTIEEQLKEALEQIEALKTDAQKNKDAQSKASAEAADYKRKYQEKLTAEEKAKAEAEEEAKKREEAFSASQKTIEELTKKITLADNKAKLVGAGFSAERAEKIATAFGKEIPEEFFTEFKGHIEDHDKAVEAARVNGTGKPGVKADGANKTVTKEEFDKMTYSEVQKFAETNPELYKEYMK